MSLNDLHLNNHLLVQLYEHTLLETNEKLFASPAEKRKHRQQHKDITATETLAQVGDLTLKAATPSAATGFLSNETESTKEIAAPAPFYGHTPSLGDNKKGVLILVSNDTAPFLPDAELEFLSAILGACKLSIADVAIVNLHRFPQTYTELVAQFQSRQVLLLGVTPQQIDLPFHFPHFQLQNFDQRSYLSSFPLRDIEQNRELKTQLWGCLKNMFGI